MAREFSKNRVQPYDRLPMQSLASRRTGAHGKSVFAWKDYSFGGLNAFVREKNAALNDCRESELLMSLFIAVIFLFPSQMSTSCLLKNSSRLNYVILNLKKNKKT